MPTKSVSVIVFSADSKLLLHQREDFRIWSLPGGHIEPDETWPVAAVRETYEETGYHIVVERLVGRYMRPQMPNGGDTRYVCLGRVIGGEPIEREPETLQVGWFPVDALPFSLPGVIREYIEDARANYPDPLEKTQRMPRWQAVIVRCLIQLRDLRNRLLCR